MKQQSKQQSGTAEERDRGGLGEEERNAIREALVEHIRQNPAVDGEGTVADITTTVVGGAGVARFFMVIALVAALAAAVAALPFVRPRLPSFGDAGRMSQAFGVSEARAR